MAILPSADTFLKGLLLPALIALGLYLSATYIFYPLYISRRRYAAYLPLSSPSFPSQQSRLGQILGGIASSLVTIRDRLMARLGLRRRDGEEMYLGDEELDDEMGGSGRGFDGGYAAAQQGGSERRLSLELEQGFRDDSDSEQDDDRGRGMR